MLLFRVHDIFKNDSQLKDSHREIRLYYYYIPVRQCHLLLAPADFLDIYINHTNTVFPALSQTDTQKPTDTRE